MNRLFARPNSESINQIRGARPFSSWSAEGAGAPPVTRAQVIGWAVLLIASIVLSILNYRTFQLGVYYDDINYVMLAQSLLRGEYGTIWHPGATGPAPFPFGFPLLLAPVLQLSGGNFEALKLVSLLSTLLNTSLIFWGWHWLSRRSRWWGVAFAALYALHPLAIDHSRMVMSEPVFLTFCLVAAMLVENLARTPSRKAQWAGSFLLSACLLLVIAIRSIGLLVVVSMLAYVWVRKGRQYWKTLAAILVQMTLLFAMLVVTTPIQLRDILPIRYAAQYAQHIQLQGGGNREAVPLPAPATEAAPGTGTAPAPEPGSRILEFSRTMAPWILHHLEVDLRNVALPVLQSVALENWATGRGALLWLNLLGLACSGVLVIGFISWYRREGLSAFFLYAVLYIPVLFLWVWDGTRLLYPVLPQILMAFLFGVEAVAGRILAVGSISPGRARLSAAFMFALVALMAAASFYKSTKVSNSYLHIGDLQDRTRWLKENADPNGVLLSEAPDVDFFYSGLHTLPYPSVSSSEQLLEFLQAQDVTYVLVAPSLMWQEFDYAPVYSGLARDTLPFLDALASKGSVERIYSSEVNLIQVYHVN